MAKVKSKVKSKKTMNVLFILDSSGSMSGLTRDAKSTYDNMVDTFLKEIDDDTDVKVGTVFFGSKIKLTVPLTSNKYNLNVDYGSGMGGTKLFDAIEYGIHLLEKESDKNATFLIVSLTDGQDNESRIRPQALKQLIQEKEKLDNWNIAFNVPQGYSKYLISSFGISDKNVREWEISSRGMQETSFANTASFVSYARNVKSGDLLASKSLYVSAQADTDGIDRSVLKNNLKKVTSSFKKLNVNNQIDIKSFVEDNGLPFAKGCAFYELTKREIIQPTKDIVIQDTNNDLYTGNDARNLLGIPTNVYSKVTPADHNSYKIFVKSTSSNRILKSGTQLLYKV